MPNIAYHFFSTSICYERVLPQFSGEFRRERRLFPQGRAFPALPAAVRVFAGGISAILTVGLPVADDARRVAAARFLSGGLPSAFACLLV